MISAFVADSTVRSIIGSRSRHRDTFLRLVEDGLKIMPGMSLPDLFPSSRLAMLLSRVPAKIERRRRGMMGFIDTIIQEHQESRAAAAAAAEDEDLLDVLLRLQKDMDSQYPLTTMNIKSILIDMFGAGSETSATTLQWAMAELMRNPEVMRRAQDEVRRELAVAGNERVTEDSLPSLHYLRLVIKETLRLHPPAPLLLPRECGGACEVLGYDVPAGTMVLVNAWAIGRDTAAWGGAAEEFSPERFERCERDFGGVDFELIPFGAGRRICPGMAFGLAHVELALAALLFHFDWRLPGGMAADEMDMSEAAGITVRRRSDLLVFAVPRVPVPAQQPWPAAPCRWSCCSLPPSRSCSSPSSARRSVVAAAARGGSRRGRGRCLSSATCTTSPATSRTAPCAPWRGALARRHGALMLLRLGEVQAVVASSPDAAREIMRTHDAAFASRPLSPMQQLAYGRDAEGVIFAPYGDGWRHLRKICTAELLSARRVQSFRPVREAELGRLLRSVAEATSSSSSSSLVNLTELISAFVADSTVRAIIGSRFEHRDAYLRMLQDGLKIVPGMTLPDLFPSSRLALFLSRVPGRIEHHRQGMQRFIDAIIDEHQEKRAAAADDDDDEDEDLLDVLLKLQKEMGSQHPLTTANIKTVMLDMFGAGSKSSATVLQWTMAELMRNPRVMQKAQDEVRRELAMTR
uniref:Cytochrome P450 n=1 Tax=Oryza meridionalis TaxID=40149 RepID=A0A0E0CGY2_9ORYZ